MAELLQDELRANDTETQEDETGGEEAEVREDEVGEEEDDGAGAEETGVEVRTPPGQVSCDDFVLVIT